MAHETLPRLGRTLSLDPRDQALAYAFFEDGDLTDCRIRSIRKDANVKDAKSIVNYITFLLDYYDPVAVLFPEVKASGSRPRSARTAQILRVLKREVSKRGVALHIISVSDIKKWVLTPEGAPPENQREVNREVLRRYPELTAVVPRPRSKPWHEEQHFTPLFHAVAMYLAFEGKPSPNRIRDAARC